MISTGPADTINAWIAKKKITKMEELMLKFSILIEGISLVVVKKRIELGRLRLGSYICLCGGRGGE